MSENELHIFRDYKLFLSAGDEKGLHLKLTHGQMMLLKLMSKCILSFPDYRRKEKSVSLENGFPAWSEIPPPTHEEQITAAEQEKQQLINQANDYMNSKQWHGKAAIGRLKGGELAQYNLWLDYLDALELVDTSGAPGIEWPTPPAAVQAR